MITKIVSLFFIIYISNFKFLIPNSSIAYAIEVGGHLTENTVWSPANNPYHVIDDVYVDNNITLTILPGTVVKLNASPLTCESDMDNFVYFNGANIAKMIQVDGELIANGTEEEPIIFTRIQDSLYYHWGIIYLRESADLCTFRYCTFEYSAFLLIAIGLIPNAAVNVHNEQAIIENCNFVDNFSGVYAESEVDRIAITNNNFYNIDNISPTYPGYHIEGEINIHPYSQAGHCTSLIAGNSFMGISTGWLHNDIIGNAPSKLINNYFLGASGIRAYMESDIESYIVNNEFINCGAGIFGGEEDNSLYIKNNRFIGGTDGIDINNAFVEISDNYFEGCELDTGVECSGKVFNNFVNLGRARTPGYLEVFNNVSFNSNFLGIGATYRNVSFSNCSSIFNEYAFGGAFWGIYYNCVFIGNEEITQNGVVGNPIFRNCILDFELPPECIDGGGNIWVDELQSQELFENIESGDFHLIEGSLAIDAGFDTLGYYYPFDLDYNFRVWDGDNNGSAIIDIGPYEYEAPQLGKITGYITETNSGVFVDYVLLKIDNEPGNFTFADSAGYFEIHLPSETYDIYAERVFYEDNIVYSVTVEDEQTTEITFNMTSTLPQVGIENENIQSSIDNIQLSNYPNPFNPSTTISFSIQNDAIVELSIFNIKGQKVTTLINEQMQNVQHSIIWSGLDSNNKSVGSGIYFYKLKINRKEFVKRMILLK